MRTKSIFQMFLTAAVLLLTAQSAWAVTYITAQQAHDNVADGTGIIIDVRTVEEHNSCNALWMGTPACPTAETGNWGAPQWTDIDTGVLMQAPNIPYWIYDGDSTTVPEDPAAFTANFEALRLAGTISYDSPIYLICRSGYRSYYGGVFLEGLGYTNVYSVDADGVGNATGGMLEWSLASLPKHTTSTVADRGWMPPQIYSDDPVEGGIATNPVTFSAGIIRPPFGRGAAWDEAYPVTQVSLYIDGTWVEDATIADPIGNFQSYIFSPQTLSAGAHTWNVRAENVLGEVSWNLRAHSDTSSEEGLSGPGRRTLTITGGGGGGGTVPNDFDGDGKADVFWRNVTNGQNRIWIMDGATVTSNDATITIGDTNWQVAGTGDFDGDGKADVLWRHASNGQNRIWIMDGATVVSNVATTTIGDTNWTVAQIGDFNGDGKADVLWRHAGNGQNRIWIMDGATVTSNTATTSVGDVNWEVQ